MNISKGRAQRLTLRLWLQLLIGTGTLVSAFSIPGGTFPLPIYRTDLETVGTPPPLAEIRRVVLSGTDFRQLWTEALTSLPDLKPHTVKPDITGEKEADGHIQDLAETRGYRLQAESTAQLILLDGQLVHPDVKAAWRRLVAAARKDRVGLVNNSGYRSVARQRQLFLSRFRAAGGSRYSHADIASGRADGLLGRILATTSIPGYSRHHTGYTVDIGDRATGQMFQSFAASPGYRWMSRDNYVNARRHGFIPSYPPGAGRQGPNPEPWEFVWIGDLQIPSYSPS